MTKKKQPTWQVICMGIACVTTAEIYNLYLGNNGTYFAIFVAIIAGAIGVTIPTPKFLQK